MKRLVLFIIAFLMLGAAAQAQIIPDGTMKRSGSRMKIDGKKIDRITQEYILSDIGGKNYTAEWRKYNNARVAGIWMVAGGSVVTLGGIGTVFVGALAGALGIAIAAGTGAVVGSVGGEEGSQQAAQDAANNVAEGIAPIINTGMLITGIGAVSTIAGIPVIVSSCKKMNRIVGAWNARHLSFDAPELSIGPSLAMMPGGTAPGVGVTLTF